MPGIVNPKVETVTSGDTLTNEVLYPYPCIVHSIHVAHASGSAAWIQVHDSATVPAEGSVPRMAHGVSNNGDADIEPFRPLYFQYGVYVCESDTLPTKTLHSGLDLFVHMHIEVSPGTFQ